VLYNVKGLILTDILVGGSRSSTPTTRKSPVSDAGVQVSPPPQAATREEKKKSPIQQQRPPPQQQRQQQQQQQQQQDDRPQRRSSGQHPQQGQNNQGQHQGQHQGHNQGHQNYPHQNNYNQGYHQGYNQGYGGRGGQQRGRGTRRPPPRGRGSFFNQGNRQRLEADRAQFEKDYDFDAANEEFEELKNQLAKTKITENGSATEGKENVEAGTGETISTPGEKKDDSGHETAGEIEEHDPCYDKAKSFFDSISCEAIERSKGKSQRPDWRLERKINVETFGVSSARRGYYPRGRGGYYRGGYYRNYNYNYNNQGFYRGGGGGGGGGGGWRGGRGGNPGGRGGMVNGSGPRREGGGAGSSYASAVRNAAASPVK